MEKAKVEHTPIYFEKMVDEFTGDEYFKYATENKRDYWHDRQQQDWDHLPDIFSGSVNSPNAPNNEATNSAAAA